MPINKFDLSTMKWYVAPTGANTLKKAHWRRHPLIDSLWSAVDLTALAPACIVFSVDDLLFSTCPVCSPAVCWVWVELLWRLSPLSLSDLCSPLPPKEYITGQGWSAYQVECIHAWCCMAELKLFVYQFIWFYMYQSVVLISDFICTNQ